MLNKQKHQLIMGRILKDIYSDIFLLNLLGFKGGTSSYFFYKLPRFSVDLDFDLFLNDKKNQKKVFEKLKIILKKYGQIKDSKIKNFTLFFFLSYGQSDHNIKVEINTRSFAGNIKYFYELKEYLGISMMIAKKDYLFAGKLIALTSRSRTIARDIYDIWYFAKNNWDINAQIIKDRTGKDTKKYLKECVLVIEKFKDNQILQGLGELLDEKQKNWIKNNLKSEVIFMLKNYISCLSEGDL